MNMNVLIVEDQRDVLERLIKICKQAGWEVHQASTEAEARQEIAVHSFEVIVWDFDLPEDAITLSLIETARARFPNAKMIAAAANRQKREMQVAAGCDLAIKDPLELYGLVHKTLSSYVSQ